MMFADVSRYQHPQCAPHLQRYMKHQTSTKGLDFWFQGNNQRNFQQNSHDRDGLGIRTRQTFQSHPQYALPVQQDHPVAIPQETNAGPQPVRIESSEHMLRRKTPNGTLSAGYDGTPVEWATRPHASKHYLVPGMEVARHKSSHPAAISSPQAHSPFGQHMQSMNSDDLLQNAWHNSIVASQNGGGLGMGIEGDLGKAINWVQHDMRPPSIDSMLHQASTSLHGGFHTNGYQQVPTVLQPLWPPSAGPTASNAQGRYGPYWPDGSFEPYRPAALRDERFQGQFSDMNLNGPVESLLMQDGDGWTQNLPPQSTPMSGVFPSQESIRHSGFDPHFDPTHGTFGHFSPYGNSASNQFHNQRHYTFNTPSSLNFHGRSLSARHAPLQRGANLWSSPPLTAQFIPTLSDHEAPQNRQQFKTKVLTWAHRIYVNLVHQSRRQHQLKQPTEKHHQAIYPKPPAQSYQNSHGHSNASRKGGFHDQYREEFLGRRTNYPKYTPENKQDGLQWPPAKPRSTFHERHDRGLRLAEPLHSHAHPKRSDFRQTTNAASNGLPFTAPLPAHQQIHSSAAEAQAALDMLECLCQESNWQWIDGILLGGCLAYGLEQFELALRWYSRVLDCDPDNVEAISNMAAAHLSLKQRKEAEQHWFRAVKLRPSYFEAVEHLVGLLCSEQRGPYAVEVIECVETSLREPDGIAERRSWDRSGLLDINDSNEQFQFDTDRRFMSLSLYSDNFGTSGYRVPGSDNGRLLALIHAKGNMLYALGDNLGAAKAFEEAVMIGAGRRAEGINGLIKHILRIFAQQVLSQKADASSALGPCETILLLPKVALKTAELVFPNGGQLPGLKDVPDGQSRKAAISVASNSLLSLAKIYQDGMSSGGASAHTSKGAPRVQDILALYYLSLSLQPSPSTANNVGILLASVQQTATSNVSATTHDNEVPMIPGVVPGSGIALALAYYNYGLNLDNRHAHLYTNLGSLLKDIGQLNPAIKMYEQAVACDENFDIALANLANAVKDQGCISDAIGYYKRAVVANPEFAEAVCGLANALNSVCSWKGRGGISFGDKNHDRWHVNDEGMLVDAREPGITSSGWIGRVVAIVEKQLRTGQSWGKGILRSKEVEKLFSRQKLIGNAQFEQNTHAVVLKAVDEWAGQDWDGAKIVRLVERATKRLGWQMYQERYVHKSANPPKYARPQLPASLAVPSAPTVLPFHTFTCPLTAGQIRKISQRNGLRISASTLKAPWLPSTIFDPPAPPSPSLNVGYVSSDFNNHPLAHLMQSVFGFHDTKRVRAFCYATTASDSSSHREQIQREAPIFHDASAWPIDRLVRQIVDDGIHILINLNGYTRGARNEVFAARPAPIQMSFMGFAGTLGAEWCDYLLADRIAVPPSMLRPYRHNVDLLDQTRDKNYCEDGGSEWVYGENIIYARETFFCCDHRQSAPDSREAQLSWSDELLRRKRMRKEIFPDLPEDAVILGNFNQLYKIDPTTFRTWLRILQSIPTAILWLLRFPDLGEANVRATATAWSTASVARRIVFTDVAPKHQHISRARVCDLFLDTPECNAHTTAADVLWSGTPLLTLPRYEYKMCSRMAASILRGALPRGERGDRMARELTADGEEGYERLAVELASGLAAVLKGERKGCRLLELRRVLYEGRWSSALFDTKRWVRDLEEAYEEVWRRWVVGEGGDIWL